MFTPANTEVSPVSVLINEDGTYRADKVPVGEAKVSVVTSYMKTEGFAGKGPPKYDVPEGKESNYKPGGAASDNAKRYVWIPDKYADPSHSGLQLTVKSGSQVYNIPLE